METWSISPSSDIASIDSSTGEARFGNHTSDVTYTISYNDSTCGTITKSFTVYKCGTPSTCTCSDLTVNGKTIESEGGTNITIGTYSTTCVTNIGASADKEWVTITSTSGGVIKATVGSYGGTTDNRTATITVTGTAADESSSCSKPFTLTQKKQGGSTCDCDDFGFEDSAEFLCGGSSKVIGSGPTACTITCRNAPSWITCSRDGEDVVLTASPNGTNENRTGSADIYMNNTTKCETISLSQPSCNCEQDYTIKYGITFDNDCIVMDSTSQAAASITIRELVLDYIDGSGTEKQLNIKESSSTNQLVFRWANVVDNQTIEKTFTQKLPCDIDIKGVHGDSRWFSSGSMFLCEACNEPCSPGDAGWCGDFQDTNGSGAFTKYAGGGLSNSITYNYAVDVQDSTIFIQMTITNAFA